MITNRDAKATKISGMTETGLARFLAERGYTGGTRESYIADAKQRGATYLLGLETIRYNRVTGKFTIVIPNDTEACGDPDHSDQIEEFGSCDSCGMFASQQTPRHVCISQPCPVCGQIDDPENQSLR